MLKRGRKDKQYQGLFYVEKIENLAKVKGKILASKLVTELIINHIELVAKIIENALEDTYGNQVKAVKLLGITSAGSSLSPAESA